MKQPIQPTYKDAHGVLRFHPNKIIQYLLDNGGIDMNKIARLKDIPREDREQFAQLIGYSVVGSGDLSYMSDATYEAAFNENELKEKSPQEAYREGYFEGQKTILNRIKCNIEDALEEAIGDAERMIE